MGDRTARPGLASDAVAGMVSVIIPVYNRAAMLVEAVESALRQTRTNLEVIIVDDGSTDDTPEVARSLSSTDRRVRVIRIPHQGLAGVAREAGTRVARGDFVQYLDSDDLIDPRKFEILVALLEAGDGAGVVYTPTNRQRPDGTFVPAVPPPGARRERMFPTSLAERLWLTPSPVYRRSVVQAAGPWSNLRCWEDIEFDTRIAALDPVLRFHAEPLTTVRDHDGPRLSGLTAYDDPIRLADMARAVGMIERTVAGCGFDRAPPQSRMFASEVLLLGERCRANGLAESEALCRAIAERLAHPAARMRPLPIAATVRPSRGALTAAPGETIRVDVALANLGAVTMRGGNFAFEIVAQVRDSEGRAVGEASREVVSTPIDPGASGVLPIPVQAPEATGVYFVEFDVLWGATRLIGGPGNPLATVKLLVTAREGSIRSNLSCHEQAIADLEWPEAEPGAVQIAIRTGGTAPWHVQLNRGAIPTVAGGRYRVRAVLRADAARPAGIGVALARAPWSGLGHYAEVVLGTAWETFEWTFVATGSAGSVRLHVDAGLSDSDVLVRELSMEALDGVTPDPAPILLRGGRPAMDAGVDPLSRFWGRERGLPPHRYYIEQFLGRHAADIRGRCLEFQDPTYAPRFGRDAITRLDLLHVDDTNPLATLVADLTKPNDLPSNAFDCIICTHVLQLIEELPTAIRELHRILAPGGVLLVGEPHVSMASDDYGEIWRFTPHGLQLLLGRAFGSSQVDVTSWGNSLVSAGDFRGLVADEFTSSELATHDRPFALEVCARAVKAG